MSSGDSERVAWSTALDLSYVTKYVWRGIPVTSESVFQPSFTVAHSSGTSANVWANMDVTDVNGLSGEVNEIDYTLDYSWEDGFASLSAGFIRYTFPNTPFTATSEVYAGAGFDVAFSKRSLRSEDDRFGMGVVVLRVEGSGTR